MKPLSIDLRQRIVHAYERGEGSQADLARRFGVGTSTVTRLLNLWRQNGSLQPKKPGGSALLVSEQEHGQVEAWIKQQPDLSQDELAQRFEQQTGRRVSRRTMGRVRARLGLTRKKRP